jgi:hypothetical protein
MNLSIFIPRLALKYRSHSEQIADRDARVISESSASHRKAVFARHFVRAISYKLISCFSAKLEKFTRAREIILIDEIWFPSFSMIHLSDGNLGSLDDHGIVGASKGKQEINLCARCHLPRVLHRPRCRSVVSPGWNLHGGG